MDIQWSMCSSQKVFDLLILLTWIIHERHRKDAKTQRRKEYWYACYFATKRKCFLSQARLHGFYSFASLGFAVYELFRLRLLLLEYSVMSINISIQVIITYFVT